MTDATVVIPTFNRSGALLSTLHTLDASTNAGITFEVVVVDDGSTDDTAAVLAELRPSRYRLRYLRQDNAGPAAARNRGAASGSGRILVFLDDDVLVQPDFVARHIADHERFGPCCVIGRLEARLPPSTPFDRYRARLLEAFHRAHHPTEVSETRGITAANLSVERDAFLKLGGFDEDFTIASCEDWEFGMRARDVGLPVIFDPLLRGAHDDWAVTLERFCDRQRSYSESDVLLWKKYSDRSPRARLVRESSPISRGDAPGLIAKKTAKRLLSVRLAQRALRVLVHLAERVAPNSTATTRLYDACVAVAIYEGVRAGLARYAAAGSQVATHARVVHIIDANADTPFFRGIGRGHGDRFPVAIGSLAPTGPLQQAVAELGCPTFALGARRRVGYPLALLRLVRLLRQQRPDVLHAHCFDPTALGLIATRIGGTRFVFTRHHSDHNIRMGKRWHTKVDAFCARHADAVIAVSEATRDVMTRVEGVPDGLITVVYNGFEPLEEPNPSSVERLQRELAADGSPVCLTLGRLHEEKGLWVLVDAVPSVVAAVGPVTFLVAGSGPARTALEREIARRDPAAAIRFLGQRNDVAELISAADVVVQPSLAESFGFALLEAGSLGRPVVASSVGGIPEIVVDGETGLLVDPEDADALADAIIRVLIEPDLARRLGVNARARARCFAMQRMVDEYEAVYERVLRTGRR